MTDPVAYPSHADFYSDSGAPCPTCQGTVKAYLVNPSHVATFCYGCHGYGSFIATSKPTTPAEVSAAERAAWESAR